MILPMRDNSQICQQILYDSLLPDYYAAIRQMCRDDEAQELLNTCAINLKRYVVLDKRLCFTLKKTDAVRIEDLTIGQLLAGAHNCLQHRGSSWTDDIKKHMDMVADTIITGTLIVPMNCLRDEYYRSLKENDDNCPTDWSYVS